MRPQSNSGKEYEIRFESLFDPGRGYTFPCDSDGHVDLDHASERARTSYLFARGMVGRDFAYPIVRAVSVH